MSYVKRLLIEVFDQSIDSSLFIVNGNIDITCVLEDYRCVYNLLFCHIWKLIFKSSFPTKLDYEEFIKKAPCSLSPNIKDMLQVFVDQPSKMIFRCGLMNFIDTSSIISSAKEFYKQLTNSKELRLKCLNEKLDARYPNRKVDKSTNMMQYIHQLIKTDVVEVQDFLCNRIECNNPNMSKLEKVQYKIYSDTHFLLKILDNAIIYVQNTDVKRETLEILKSCYDTKYVVELRVDTPIDPHKDPLVFYGVSSIIYNILPRISRNQITISNNYKTAPTPMAECNKSILYNMIDEDSIDPQIIVGHSQYDKVISNSLYCSGYVILEPNTIFDDNDISIKYVDNNQIVSNIRKGIIPKISYESRYICNMVNGIVSGNAEISDVKEIPDMVTSTLKVGMRCLYTLMHKDFVSHMWSEFIKTPCPKKSKNPRHGMLLYLEFIPKYFMKNLGFITILKHNPRASHCMVLIDNRPNILSVLSMMFSMINVNDDWQCIIYTSRAAMPFYDSWVGHFAIIRHLPELDCVKFHIDYYNYIMTDVSFWKSINNYYKCLIIQDDGVLLSRGIEQFMISDYVGAPWADAPENQEIKETISANLVGNGGLSLRTIESMIHICEKHKNDREQIYYYNIINLPEDLFFVKYIEKCGFTIEPLENAVNFAAEQVIISNKKQLGFHKVWAYNQTELVIRFFNQFVF